MAKYINLNDDNNSSGYHLEFTARSIKKVFESDFAHATESNPILATETLFWGAMLKEKPMLTKKQSDTILYNLTGENGRYAFDMVSKAVVELFSVTRESIQSPENREDILIEGDDPKNAIPTFGE